MRRVQRSAGARVVLAAKVHDLVAPERAYDGHLVHLGGEFGKEAVREVETVADLPDVEVVLGAGVLFEIERVGVANGAGGLDDDAVAGRAARVGAAGGAQLRRP